MMSLPRPIVIHQNQDEERVEHARYPEDYPPVFLRFMEEFLDFVWSMRGITFDFRCLEESEMGDAKWMICQTNILMEKFDGLHWNRAVQSRLKDELIRMLNPNRRFL